MKADCGCHTELAKKNTFERPRFYARQLVTADDLTLEQDYGRAKLRLHNRFLHGWGVVCGAILVKTQDAWKVKVTKGYILTPAGDDIYIDKDACIDVRKRCDEPEEAPDDPCAEPPPAREPSDKLFVAVRYKAEKLRLVRVPLGGCGCEDTACEYSRSRDSYEICILEACPPSHSGDAPDPASLRSGEAPVCTPCPDDAWVVLGAITVDEAGKVETNPCECRRQVVSHAHDWWMCTPPGA